MKLPQHAARKKAISSERDLLNREEGDGSEYVRSCRKRLLKLGNWRVRLWNKSEKADTPAEGSHANEGGKET